MNAPRSPWPPGYRTQRVLVRQVEPEDVTFIARLHTEPEVMQHIAEALSEADAEVVAQRLVRAARCKPPLMHAWILQAMPADIRIGLMTVAPTGPVRGELGLLFARHLSRRGYATEVVAALLDHVHAVGAAVDARHRPDNLAVQQLMLRLRFMPCGSRDGYAWWRSDVPV